ncbi:MAG: HAMP domain-containing sensor histidine kinase [Actinomycetota bacterium]
MTLRTRVILIVTILVVGGIAVASVLAYQATSEELNQETDRFLTTRAAELIDGRREAPQDPPPDNDRGGSRGSDDRDDDHRNSTSSTSRSESSASPASTVTTTTLAEEEAVKLAFDPDAFAQTLSSDGEILTSGGALLPVSDVDVAIAGGADSVIRNITVDGVDYRMITVHDPAGGAVQVARLRGTTDDVLTGLIGRLVVVGIVLAIVAAAMGWILMRRATRPLEDLTAATEHVAETLELTPLGLHRHDEVGRVADAFDQMLGALSLSREQQRRLVQDAGHELRTPLTSLRANIELLDRADDLPTAERAAMLRDVNAEIIELGELINELIQLATDTSAAEEPMADLDLADVVESAVERFRRRTGRVVTIDLEPTSTLGHVGLLDRAVSNLLVNADKFSPPGAPVDVSLLHRTVTVSDRGPGIPVADQDRVFDRFYRGDTARGAPGSGLGLAIVRQIAEQHGGTATATDAPDGGAAVSFTVGPPPA